jgi:hypothetical protein
MSALPKRYPGADRRQSRGRRAIRARAHLDRDAALVGPGPLFRVGRIKEIEVAALCGRQIGHQALVDPMRVDDDPTFGSLPEDLGQARDRDGRGCGNVRQYLPGPTDDS